MTNLTKPEQFDQAFMRVTDHPVEGFAYVTVGKVRLLVSDYYCPFCRDNGTDGEAWCRHKEAAFRGDHDDDGDDLRETYEAALDVGVQ